MSNLERLVVPLAKEAQISQMILFYTLKFDKRLRNFRLLWLAINVRLDFVGLFFCHLDVNQFLLFEQAQFFSAPLLGFQLFILQDPILVEAQNVSRVASPGLVNLQKYLGETLAVQKTLNQDRVPVACVLACSVLLKATKTALKHSVSDILKVLILPESVPPVFLTAGILTNLSEAVVKKLAEEVAAEILRFDESSTAYIVQRCLQNPIIEIVRSLARREQRLQSLHYHLV